MKKILFLTLFFVSAATALADDSIAVEKPSFFERVYEVIKDFSRIDTNYIEPQHYNFTAMLQNTNTFESYTLRNEEGQELVLSPEPSFRIGPYFGWRWLFLGYAIDISHLNNGGQRQDWSLSFYSNQVGVDLFFRKTGDDYKIRLAKSNDDIAIPDVKDLSFSGFRASIKGINLYYILNHRKFSYPAAFNQSTCQKISAGSPLIGIGYTKHKITLDTDELGKMVNRYTSILGLDPIEFPNSAEVNFTDISLSGGYAYNWVFAKNWLAAASLALAVGYKHSTGDTETNGAQERHFSFRNFNLDGVGRFGLVWNNTRWYAGTSFIMHTYRYSKSHFSTNSFFGNWNIYFGYNFGKKSAYRD